MRMFWRLSSGLVLFLAIVTGAQAALADLIDDEDIDELFQMVEEIETRETGILCSEQRRRGQNGVMLDNGWCQYQSFRRGTTNYARVKWQGVNESGDLAFHLLTCSISEDSSRYFIDITTERSSQWTSLLDIEYRDNDVFPTVHIGSLNSQTTGAPNSLTYNFELWMPDICRRS